MPSRRSVRSQSVSTAICLTPLGRLDPLKPADEQHAAPRRAPRATGRVRRWSRGHDPARADERHRRLPDHVVADVDAVTAALSDPPAYTIGLLADLYHLGRNGEDVDALLTRPSAITHVQIADAPGRHEPGTGSLPIRRWLDALERNGYDRRVALEYEPSTDAAHVFDWLTT